MKKPIQRFFATLLIPSLLFTGMPLSASAALVSTEQVAAEAVPAEATRSDTQREKLGAFLAREDVRAALQAHGVSADEAQARVHALSDTEVAQLAQRVDQAPAGGDVLGLLFMTFVILLVTDILGFTKVFPFTRSVR